MLIELFFLEIRSIWRTRRMRQLLLLTTTLVPLFSANFILNSNSLWINVSGKAIIISLLFSGLTAFTFSKDSGFYPALQSRPVAFFHYTQAKYWLALLLCQFCYVVVQFFDLLAARQYWGFNFAIFTIGASIILPLVILTAAFDRQRIDTSRNIFLNYEGVALGRQTLPTLPILVFFISPQFWVDWWLALLAIGATALMLQNKVIAKNAAILQRRKHIMLEGFRQ